MGEEQSLRARQAGESGNLKSFVKNLGIDLVGVTDLGFLKGMPLGIPSDSAQFLQRYRRAIVLGAQLGKLRNEASGPEVSAFLEGAARAVESYLEERGYRALTVHPDDESDPINRMGLMSLKVLAKGAGLGWQGRSLLIVSPEYGPIHRWIAVLTDMDLKANELVPNQCGDCSLCIDMCPERALTWIPFDDHPEHREDVLNIAACKGDDGCKVCLVVCPWAK